MDVAPHPTYNFDNPSVCLEETYGEAFSRQTRIMTNFENGIGFAKLDEFSRNFITIVNISDTQQELGSALPTYIATIKESFGFSITEIANIFGVSRPTIYSWKKGETKDTSTQHINKLQNLSALAKVWQQHTSGSEHTHILDYKGTDADEATIRELLHQDFDLETLKALIPRRVQQFAEGVSKTKEILGNSAKLEPKETNLTEGARAMHEMWAENSAALREFRDQES